MTAAFIFAEALTSRVLSQPNFLADAASQTTLLATGAVLLFAGALLVALEHHRVKRVEQRWLTEHPDQSLHTR